MASSSNAGKFPDDDQHPSSASSCETTDADSYESYLRLRRNTSMINGCGDLILAVPDDDDDQQAMGAKQGMKSVVREQNERGETILHEAVRRADKDMVRQLMSLDSTLALVSSQEDASPLYLAISLGYHDIAQMMYNKSGGQLSCSGPNGQNGLHASVLRSGVGVHYSKYLYAYWKEYNQRPILAHPRKIANLAPCRTGAYRTPTIRQGPPPDARQPVELLPDDRAPCRILVVPQASLVTLSMRVIVPQAPVEGLSNCPYSTGPVKLATLRSPLVNYWLFDRGCIELRQFDKTLILRVSADDL
uniref:Uncharacterized protein n=1 Tax=Oryza brachyantha TaxID=4533 RepID=J3MWL5_ORYBR